MNNISTFVVIFSDFLQTVVKMYLLVIYNCSVSGGFVTLNLNFIKILCKKTTLKLYSGNFLYVE